MHKEATTSLKDWGNWVCQLPPAGCNSASALRKLSKSHGNSFWSFPMTTASWTSFCHWNNPGSQRNGSLGRHWIPSLATANCCFLLLCELWLFPQYVTLEKIWKWAFTCLRQRANSCWKKWHLRPGAPRLSQTFHWIKISACNLRGKIKL